MIMSPHISEARDIKSLRNHSGMDVNRVKELLPIFHAFSEGREIEYKVNNASGWQKATELVCLDTYIYRIKPEPKYRPFRTQEECWDEMHKHPDLGWVMAKNKKELVQIGRILMSKLDNVMITLSIDEGRNFNSSYYFNHYTFTDGAPFGIKEE